MNFKKFLISGKVVGFLKFIGEIKQLERKRSQKNKFYVILNTFHFQFINCIFQSSSPFKNNKKTPRHCRDLVKITLTVYLILYKLIFFETLIIFLEPRIKLITEMFDLQK